MNRPLAIFVQGLISCNTLVDPAEIDIVQDNCGKLTEEARSLVRLSYRSSILSDTSCSCSRWDTCEVVSSEDAPKKCPKDTTSSCSRPSRRSSLEAGGDTWKTYSTSCIDKTPHMPPRDAIERSTLRWALALDGLDSLSSDDDCSSSDTDSDSETTYNAADLDFGDYFSGSDLDSDDDDDDESDVDTDDDKDEEHDSSSSSGSDSQWQGKKINAHEWTLPPNALLPNLQSLFREAALNRDVDINQRIKALTMAGLPQVS